MCPNSVFRDKEDVPTTEYYTTDELNVEIQKTPDNLRLIHPLLASADMLMISLL